MYTRTASDNFQLMLGNLLKANPSGVKQVMQEFGANVPVSTDAVYCLARINGKPFTDELFILANALANTGNSRFAGLGGPVENANIAKAKNLWDKGFGIATDILGAATQVKDIVSGIKNPSSGSGEIYDYDVNAGNKPDPEKKKYFGLSPLVFFGGISVLVLVIIFLAVRHK
jgi:hypothetical protein